MVGYIEKHNLFTVVSLINVLVSVLVLNVLNTPSLF